MLGSDHPKLGEETSPLQEAMRRIPLPNSTVRVQPSPPPSNDENYSPLRSVLDAAYLQAAEGKGKERHANGKPFTKQPIMEIGRMVGAGYQTGQAMKKCQEANSMNARGEKEQAINELLGAIVYCAAAILLIRES